MPIPVPAAVSPDPSSNSNPETNQTPAESAPVTDYKVSQDAASTAEIDAALEALCNAHPGVKIKKEQRVWFVTFDAGLRPTGTQISKAYDFPDPHPVEGSAEYNAFAEDMKKAAQGIVLELDGLTDAEKQYYVTGFFFDYWAGNECVTVTTSTAVFENKVAKPLMDAEKWPLREAAKDVARTENKLQADPDYRIERHRMQVEKVLDDLRQANPGAEERHRIALYSVAFDAKREPTATTISKGWEPGQPQPATAMESVSEFDGLLVAERQYVVFGEVHTVAVGEKATDACITQRIHQEPRAKALSDAEKRQMTDAANAAVYKTIDKAIDRAVKGEPSVLRVKDLRRDHPEMAADLSADTPEDATVAVKLKPLSARHPKGWKPKGWTHRKEKLFQSWLADGKPDLVQGGEPLPDDPNLCSADDELREMFDDVMKAAEKQERTEREIAELVRRSGGTA